MGTVFKNPLWAAFMAFACYGVWAGFSNITFGLNVAFKALLIQGCFAFVSTLLAAALSRKLLIKLKNTPYAVIYAFIITMSVLILIPLSLHLIFATPNVLASMAPGVVFGGVYIGWIIGYFHLVE